MYCRSPGGDTAATLRRCQRCLSAFILYLIDSYVMLVFLIQRRIVRRWNGYNAWNFHHRVSHLQVLAPPSSSCPDQLLNLLTDAVFEPPYRLAILQGARGGSRKTFQGPCMPQLFVFMSVSTRIGMNAGISSSSNEVSSNKFRGQAKIWGLVFPPQLRTASQRGQNWKIVVVFWGEGVSCTVLNI